MNANFCVFEFFFLVETDPEAPRSETLVAGLRSVLAILQPETMLLYLYSWIERPCHNRHTVIVSGCRIARTDPRPATSVSERGASGSVSIKK